MNVLEGLRSIPDAVWGVLCVLLGSGLSILGGVVAERHAARRLHSQFEHERAVALDDRRYQLRKEAYFELLTFLDDYNKFLGNMMMVWTGNKAALSPPGRTSVLDAAQLVAGERLFQELSNLDQQMGGLSVDLYQSRARVLTAKSAYYEMVEHLDARVANSDEERNSVLARFESSKQELISAYEFHIKSSAAQYDRFQDLKTPVKIAIRQELGFPVLPEHVRSQGREAKEELSRKVKTCIDQMLSDLRPAEED